MLNDTIVVDGPNVASQSPATENEPRVENLVAMIDKLKTMGYKPIVVIDANLCYCIDDPAKLNDLIKNKAVRQVPENIKIHSFILKTADELRTKIISNNRYDQYAEKYPWLEERRIPFEITEGKVYFIE